MYGSSMRSYTNTDSCRGVFRRLSAALCAPRAGRLASAHASPEPCNFNPLRALTTCPLRNGEVIAVAHPVPKLANLTAKEPSIIGRLDAVRDGTVTSLYRDSYRPATGIGLGVKKPLTPYTANAPRNRLAVRFENDAWPKVRHCKPWAQAGTISLEDRRGGTDKRRFISEYQNSYMGINDMPVGVANPGIMSEKTRILHQMQLK
eukprot:tig00000405_g451.t1